MLFLKQLKEHSYWKLLFYIKKRQLLLLGGYMTNLIIPIAKVSSLLGIEVQNANKEQIRAKMCPFCGSRTAFSMDTINNAWHCFACGEKGNSITLYSKLKKVSNKDAYKALLNLAEEEHIATEEEKAKKPVLTYKRFEANLSLLNNLNLSKDHEENLLNRGLTKEDIVRLNYKTLDVQSMSYDEKDSLTKKVFENVEKLEANERIPGFYDLNTDKPKIAWQQRGFLIPVRNIRREIEGFQIRHDSLPDNATENQKALFHRYGWFTSGGKSSGIRVSGIGNIHHAGTWYYSTKVNSVFITEGALKADIAATLLDRMEPKKPHLFLGLTGVQNVSQLKEELQLLANFQLREVKLCVDMDYLTNKNVKQALENIKKIVQEVHYIDDNGNPVSLNYTIVKWNPEYKGIDDFLSAKWDIMHPKK